MISTIATWYCLAGIVAMLWLTPMEEERFIIYLLWVVFWPLWTVLTLFKHMGRE